MTEEKQTLEENLNDARIIIKTIDKYIGLRKISKKASVL